MKITIQTVTHHGRDLTVISGEGKRITDVSPAIGLAGV